MDYNTSPQHGKPCFLVGCNLESQSGSQEKRKLSELELDKKPVDSGSKQGDYQVPADSYSLYLAWLPISLTSSPYQLMAQLITSSRVMSVVIGSLFCSDDTFIYRFQYIHLKMKRTQNNHTAYESKSFLLSIVVMTELC